MFIDRAGWPFVLGALLVAVAVGLWLGRAWSVPFLILAAFFLFFSRDPDRNPPTGAHLVLSPADARVMVAGETVWPGAPAGGGREGHSLNSSHTEICTLPLHDALPISPDRNPPTGAHLVLSPADARVMVAGETVWPGAPAG